MLPETDQIQLLDERKAQTAAVLGLTADRIGIVKLETRELRRNGLLVDIDIRGVSMFTRQADWYEIGVHVDDIRADRLTRGRKYLIPEEMVKKFNSIESSARSLLDRLTYNVSVFRPYRFLPYTAYDKFREEWGRLSGRFDLLVQEVLENYDQYCDELAADFAAVADASWRSIVAQGYGAVIIAGRGYTDPEEFKAEVVARAMAKLPAREKIQTGLSMDYTPALLFGTEDLAAEDARAEVLRAEAHLKTEQFNAKAREAYLQASILQDQHNHQVKMAQMEEEEKSLKLDAMLRAESEHIRQQLQQIASPYDEVFAQLRDRVGEAVTEMAASVKKSGFVRGKVAERGRGLLEFFDLMATHDDRELRARLVQLRAALDKPAGNDAGARSTEEVIAALEDITDLIGTTANGLTHGPSRFSLID